MQDNTHGVDTNSLPVINVILDDIRSALNVGAFFRTSDAAQVKKLLLTGITPYPPHNRIPKTALGSIDNVNWEYFREKEKAISNVIEENPTTDIVAVELTENADVYWDYNFTDNTTLIFGHEIEGVSSEYLDKTNATVMIPMLGKKESLNVAVSYGIIVYEIIRQHISRLNQ